MPLHRGDLNDANRAKTLPLAAKKSAYWATCCGPSSDYQWHFMDSPHGCAVGRFARMLWVTWHSIKSLLSLARSRYLAGDIKSLTANCRCRESNRLGSTFYRQHHRPRSPTRRRSKKGELNPGQQSLSAIAFSATRGLGTLKRRL